MKQISVRDTSACCRCCLFGLVYGYLFWSLDLGACSLFCSHSHQQLIGPTKEATKRGRRLSGRQVHPSVLLSVDSPSFSTFFAPSTTNQLNCNSFLPSFYSSNRAKKAHKHRFRGGGGLWMETGNLIRCKWSVVIAQLDLCIRSWLYIYILNDTVKWDE